MNSSSGGKVMNLASILAAVTAILAIIEGIAVWVTMGRMHMGGAGVVIFLVIVGVGAVIAYVCYLMLYAFGELVDNSAKILHRLNNIETTGGTQTDSGGRMYPNAVEPPKPVAQSIPQGQIQCPFCKKVQPAGTVFCGGCGAHIGSR